MKIDRQDASIELSAAEWDALRGKSEATKPMLADRDHPAGAYATFKDKLEHRASELHYATDRTVLIHVEGMDDHVAIFKGEEIEIQAS